MNNSDPVSPIKPRIPVERNERSDGNEKIKPKSTPSRSSNFKELVGDESVKEKNIDESEVGGNEEASGESVSIFDLSAKKNKKNLKKEPRFDPGDSLLTGEKKAFKTLENTEDDPNLQNNEEMHLSFESGGVDESALMDSSIKKSKLFDPSVKDPASLHASSEGSKMSKEEKSGKISKEKVRSSELSEEQSEGSRATQGGQSVFNGPVDRVNFSERSISQETTPTSPTMREIVDQVVKAMEIIRKEGKTETVVTLKEPPILEGSRLVLTSFDQAKGEFNISFTNLSSQGKEFLDQQLSKNSLELALENKGVIVHQLTTTTLSEVPLIESSGESKSGGDDRREGGKKDQEGKKREKG